MSTTNVVLLPGVSTAAAMLGIEVLLGTRRQLYDAADPVAAEHWLVGLVAGRWFPRSVRPWLAVGAAVTAGLVAASRALLGVDWVTEVVAGLIVGWTWFLLVALTFCDRLQPVGEPFEEVAAIAHDLGDDAHVDVVSRVTISPHDGGRHGM